MVMVIMNFNVYCKILLCLLIVFCDMIFFWMLVLDFFCFCGNFFIEFIRSFIVLVFFVIDMVVVVVVFVVVLVVIVVVFRVIFNCLLVDDDGFFFLLCFLLKFLFLVSFGIFLILIGSVGFFWEFGVLFFFNLCIYIFIL